MGVLTANALAEVQKQAPSLHPVLHLDLPGGTKRYASVGSPLASATNGLYKDKVREWGRIRRAISDDRGALQSVDTSIVLDDVDREFAKIVEGASGLSVRGSAATILYASQNLATADWPTRFAGKLNRYEYLGAFHWRLYCRPDDEPLQRAEVPWRTIRSYDFPLAVAASLGKPIPAIYGVFLSKGITDKGLLPTYLVDTGTYLVGYGALLHILKAYTDGVAQTSGWSVERPLINGARMTRVKFTTAPATSAVVTVDAYGLSTDPDGTNGKLIQKPMHQLRHFLANFVWNQWKTGAYYTDSAAPIDVTSFDETDTFLEARRYRGSRWLGESRRAIDILNEWCEDHWGKAFWKNSGKLAIRIVDHARTSVYFNAPAWVRWPRVGKEAELPISYEVGERVDKYVASYIRDETANTYREVLEVGDTQVSARTIVTLVRPWAESRPSFDAGHFAGVKAWWPAYQLEAVSATGGLAGGIGVETWQDRSASGFALTQATSANRPTLRHSDQDANVPPYGRPYVEFDGTNDLLTGTAALSGLITAGEYTLWAVIRVVQAQTNNAGATDNDCILCDSGSKWGLYAKDNAALKIYAHNNDGTDDTVQVSASLNTWYLVRVRHYGGNLYVSLNGGAESSVASGNTAALTGTLRMGASPGATTRYFKGLIADVIVRNTGADDAEAQDIARFLADEYGLALN